MIGVVFYFEDVERNITSGVVGSVMDRMVIDCRNLGATHLFMVDTTQYKIGRYYQHTDSLIEFGYFTDLTTIEEMYSDVQFIYLENQTTLNNAGITNKTNLFDFVHPVNNVIYVVGTDMGSASIVNGRINKQWVYIPVPLLWAETVLKLCLADRLWKK